MINSKTASLAGLLVAIVALITLLTRDALLATGIVGIVVQVLAASLMLWARLTFGTRSFHASADPTEGGLVTTGPYKYLRHPIYAAILYFVWAGILSHLSIINFLLGVAATAGLAVRMFTEERLVSQRYPDYISYAKKTRRVIPFII